MRKCQRGIERLHPPSIAAVLATSPTKRRRNSGFTLLEISIVSAVTAAVAAIVFQGVLELYERAELNKINEAADTLLHVASQQLRVNCRRIYGDATAMPVIPRALMFSPPEGPIADRTLLGTFAPLSLASLQLANDLIDLSSAIDIFGEGSTPISAATRYSNTQNPVYGPEVAGFATSRRIGYFGITLDLTGIDDADFVMRDAILQVQIFLPTEATGYSDTFSEIFQPQYDLDADIANRLGADLVEVVHAYDSFNSVLMTNGNSSVVGKLITWQQPLGGRGSDVSSYLARTLYVRGADDTDRVCLF